MQQDTKIIDGYLFEDREEYGQALKEHDTVVYIRANTNMNEIKQLITIHNKLIEKKAFSTVIGFQFLHEMRQTIVTKEEALSQFLLPVPMIKKEVTKPRIQEKESKSQEKRYQMLYENLKGKRNQSKIINVFLLMILVAFLLISYHGNHASNQRVEEAVINRYSSWKEELTKKEEELKQWENELKLREERMQK